MPHPTKANARIVLLDGLRGFAVLGIFIVNFTLDVPWAWRTAATLTPQADAWIGPGIQFWLADKFRAIFALLFGIGFELQQARAARGFGWFYVRRMGWLFVIGVSNRLLRGSDILHGYAMLGVALLVLRRFSSRTLLGLAVALTLFPWKLLGRAFPADDYARLAAPVDRGFAEMVVEHGRDFLARATLVEPWTYWFGEVFPIFLIGCCIGRTRLFEIRPVRWSTGRMAVTAIAVGCVLNLSAMALARQSGWLSGISRDLATLGLAGGYCLGVALLFLRLPSSGLCRGLAATGRMALTNYLSHSLLFVLIFYPAGLGFFGSLGVAAGLAIALAGFPLQVAFSRWWLGRFRYGPVEWVWRVLSYQRMV